MHFSSNQKIKILLPLSEAATFVILTRIKSRETMYYVPSPQNNSSSTCNAISYISLLEVLTQGGQIGG
jgi:hypothetical protein